MEQANREVKPVFSTLASEVGVQRSGERQADLTNDFTIAMKPYLVCSVILCFQIVKASTQTFIDDFIIIQSWIKIHSQKSQQLFFYKCKKSERYKYDEEAYA
jgi:ribosomal protein RSM22 (predicted rRNA methylase)